MPASSASPTLRRETLSFDANVPYELVLKYATGRQISNGNIMFSTTTDEVFFLKPEDAHRIHALGLGVNEPFRLMRRVIGTGKAAKTSIIVSRIEEHGEQQPGHTFAEGNPAAAASQNTTTEPGSGSSSPAPLPQNNSLSGILARANIAAIDALLVAREYARSKGIDAPITVEDIRCHATVLFIEYGRMKDRALREKEFAARYPSTQNGNGGATWQR